MATDVARSERAANDDAVHCPAIIIGAGPAGLAVGACLKQAGVPCILLEQGSKVGAAWYGHYDRLHLHSDKAHSALPFVAYPEDYPRYPSRLQVISYLQAYARQFQLEPRLDQRVVAARHANRFWEIQTQDARYKTPNLIVASGYNRTPCIPTWPGQASFRGAVLHSSQFQNGAPFEGQEVLVVGFGNSGGEIAIDLCGHGARPSLAVRGPVNVIPRELLGIPIVAIAGLERKLPPRWADALNGLILRAVVGDLTRYGLRKSPHGPAMQIRRDARIPLIDVGTIELIKRGRIPGLYFCGYLVSPIGMLRDIAMEARQIAAAISRKRALE